MSHLKPRLGCGGWSMQGTQFRNPGVSSTRPVHYSLPTNSPRRGPQKPPPFRPGASAKFGTISGKKRLSLLGREEAICTALAPEYNGLVGADHPSRGSAAMNERAA